MTFEKCYERRYKRREPTTSLLAPVPNLQANIDAVADEDVALRTVLHALALGMGSILKDIERVEIFPRRNITQRVGLPDHVRSR